MQVRSPLIFEKKISNGDRYHPSVNFCFSNIGTSKSNILRTLLQNTAKGSNDKKYVLYLVKMPIVKLLRTYDGVATKISQYC